MCARRTHQQPKMTGTRADEDWETDPDFIRHIDEIDQRWGNKRSVGSIDMNKLIEDVRRDHQDMRHQYEHTSQTKHSDGIRGQSSNINPRIKEKPLHDFDYHEQVSDVKEFSSSKKIITSRSGVVNDSVRSIFEQPKTTSYNYERSRSPPPLSKDSKESFEAIRKRFQDSMKEDTKQSTIPTSPTNQHSSEKFSSSKIIREHSTSSGGNPDALRSVRSKIDAFRKEFDDLHESVAKKSDLSKVIKESTSMEKSSNRKYVERNYSTDTVPKFADDSSKTKKSSNLSSGDKSTKYPDDITSIQEKFKLLCNDNPGLDTAELRRKFFEEEKKKIIDRHEELLKSKQNNCYRNESNSPSHKTTQEFARSPSRSPATPTLPKVYSTRETHREEIVSRLVKENDKIVENETKRNVEKTSSCHGSSDEEQPETKVHRLTTEERDNMRNDSLNFLKGRHLVNKPDIKLAGLMARTLFDHEAAEDDEISFDADELITNIEKIDPGWYKGTILGRDGIKRSGLFPANYVKLLNDNGEF